jgi:hypothetical protein
MKYDGGAETSFAPLFIASYGYSSSVFLPNISEQYQENAPLMDGVLTPVRDGKMKLTKTRTYTKCPENRYHMHFQLHP